jgi:hypothetical protein
MATQTVYLQGPPKLTAFLLQKIVDGEVRTVEIRFDAFEKAYRSLPFSEFCEQMIAPALEQLFP